VWNTNWLSRDGLLHPVACLRYQPPQLVNELIDNYNVAWDSQKLQTLFLPMDHELIMSIPLSTRGQDDFWAWHYDRSGVFSVRTAYRMLVETREKRTTWLDERACSSGATGEDKEWSALLKVQVPSKIKVFLWRHARQSLPTMNILQNRT
jgi:hypothetical protein